MPLGQRAGAFSLNLWAAVVLVLVFIILFMRSFDSTFDEVEKLKPVRLAAVMEVALRQVRASWLANNQPETVTTETGLVLQMNGQGYPVGVAGEVLLDPAAGCARVLQFLAGDALPKERNGGLRVDTTADARICSWRIQSEAGLISELQFDTTSGKVMVLEVQD